MEATHDKSHGRHQDMLNYIVSTPTLGKDAVDGIFACLLVSYTLIVLKIAKMTMSLLLFTTTGS